MTLEQGNLILEILRRMQGDIASLKRDVSAQGMRFSALEDFVRGIVTSQFSTNAEITGINHRLDRIERRLDLTEETE